MSLASAVLALSNGTYQVTRFAADSYDAEGRLVKGAGSAVQVVASVQPVNGRDLLRLPEGLRTKELRALFATSALQTANEVAGTRADQVLIGADTYEVQTVEDWSTSGGFWKAIAAKVEP